MTQKELQKELRCMAQEEYKEFAMGLLPGVKNLLGVRLPCLRQIAKKLAKEENWKEYLSWENCGCFEEVMLQGMILGQVKAPLPEILEQTRKFLPRIDNWSVNDSFCTTFRSAEQYPEEVWDFLMEYRESDREFTVRTVAVMLMAHYVKTEYIDRVLEVLESLDTKDYYASMAVAWAFATAWAKFPEKTKDFLQKHPLEKATYLRMLQKGMESKRVASVDKQWMRCEKKRLRDTQTACL